MAFALALVSWTAACGGGGGTTTPPPPPPLPVTVSVAPTSQNVLLGATQQFTATLTNTTNTAVTWSVNGITGGNSTVGTIDVNGLYRGPAVLPSPAAVTIRATSVASPGSSGTATATVTSDVVVNITAPAANSNVELGATQQFNASVTSPGLGAPSTSVIWSVSGNGCAGAACGAISAAGGLFIAPGILPGTACSLPATGVNCVTITATSVADPSKSATLTLHIVANFGFTINSPPGNPPAMDNATQFQFVPTFTPVPNSNPITSVTWSVSGAGCPGASTACGTIDMLTGLYTAPNQAPSPPSVTITGIPTADASKAQSPTVIINTIVIVAVSPATANVEIEGQQNFTANVGGSASQNVSWDVNGIINGNAAVGFITNPGLGSTPAIYTAPPTIPTIPIVVTATSVSNPSKSASVTLTFFSTISAILQPSGSTRAVNHVQRLSGALTRTSTGTAPFITTVSWSVNGVPGGDATNGFICAVGVLCSGGNKLSASGVGNPAGDVDYVAPVNVPAGGVVTILMQSQADTSKSASAQATIVPLVVVNVSPSALTLPASQTQPFTASVLGTSNQNVTWSVSGTSCNAGPCGSISASGLYTAPGSPPASATDTVKATSQDDPTQSGIGTVTIAVGAFINRILPASITALTAPSSTAFTLLVNGSGFETNSSGTGPVIIFNSVPFDGLSGHPSTTCSSATVCSALVPVSAVTTPGTLGVQVQNPQGAAHPGLSNLVAFVVLDPATQQKDFDHAAVITVSAGPQPVCQAVNDAGCLNITVVEPTTAGTTLGAAGQVNITGIGFSTPGLCSGGGTAITITRPLSGAPPKNVDICLFGSNGLLSTYIYTISGPSPASPTDIAISGVTAFGSAVKFTLTIPSTAQAGPRTFFVETPNREKSALVGAIKVK